MWHYTVEISTDGVTETKKIGSIRIPIMNDGRKVWEIYNMLYTPNEKIELNNYNNSFNAYPGSCVNIGIGSFQYYEHNDEIGNEFVEIIIGEMLI